MSSSITDEYMKRMMSTTRPFTVVVLRKGPEFSRADARAVIWEHGRRNFSLRAEGKLCIVCPIPDHPELAGVGIFTTDPETTRDIIAGDPAVREDILRYDVCASRSFPGDHLPSPVSSLLPTLSVRDGVSALAFYQQAFNAEVLMTVADPDGHIVAELSVGGCRFFVADESPGHENFAPPSLGGSTARIALMVSDPDEVFRRALEAGAREIYPVADQHYGYRLGRLADPFGHHWEICRKLPTQ